MSHFYGSMQGSRGEVTRCGSKGGGMRAHIRSWKIGAKVECFEESGKDYVRVGITGGSGNSEVILNLGTFCEGGVKPEVKNNV